MKQLVIISGKGGTGKTSIAACFAALEKKRGAFAPVIVDCDVDAPNLHLLLKGKVINFAPFSGPERAVINRARVSDPDKCENSCAFKAISGFEVDPFSCVGCGVCRLVCGEDAVQMAEREAGTIFESDTPYGKFFHAELLPGQPGFGGLVTALRVKGEAEALRRTDSLLLIDGSPGVGCQVIASLTGCDLALVVTEPGKGAFHDLDRIHQLLRFFGMKALVMINRYNLDRTLMKEIERYCLNHDLEIAGRIPVNDLFRQAVLAGKPAVEMGDEKLNPWIEEAYRNTRQALYGV
ncbi:MAG: ATP-binding protein [PVC group bacterium]